MIDDEYIKKYFTSGNKIMKYKIKKLLDKDDEIIVYLKNRYIDSYSLEESLYRIIHNIEHKNKCPYCNKPIKLVSFKYGFAKTCNSIECNKKYKIDNSSFKKQQTQEKVKETIYKKYGVNNAYQIKEISDKAKINAHSEEANNKRINTCIKKYGVDNVSKSDIIKNKIRYVFNSKTEDEKYNIYIKHKETFKKRYNVDWYSQLPEHKEKLKLMMSSEKCLNKRRETSFNKYGYKTYNNQEKRNETMKKNNSFTKSKSENEAYSMIKEKYPETIRQYRSEKYPFNCDFYIPNINTYIEFQGCHYHNHHPFNPDNENDIKELERLKKIANNSARKKENKKSQYENIIYTWTNLDVRKRTIAKENNLNWIEFFSLNELKEWLKEQ